MVGVTVFVGVIVGVGVGVFVGVGVIVGVGVLVGVLVGVGLSGGQTPVGHPNELIDDIQPKHGRLILSSAIGV